MNESIGSYQRWRAAEEDERDEEADGAFRAMFQTVVPEHPLSPGFTARTMGLIAAAAARDARRSRRTRAAVGPVLVVGGAAAVYFGAGLAVRFLSTVFLGFLNLVIAAIVGGVSGVQTGAGLWGILSSLGRATAAFAADPTVTLVIFAIQGIAIAALVALRRLLGSNGERLE